MTAAVTGNVIPFLGPRQRPAPAADPAFERAVENVAAIPAAELLDAAHLSLSLARFRPGSLPSYGLCVTAMLCLTRLVDECRPDGREGA